MPPEATARRSARALDAQLPVFDVEQVQSLRVAASPEVIFDAASRIVPGDVTGWRTLLWVRSVPARLAGQTIASWGDPRPVLSPKGSSVVVLSDDPPWERVLGLVGRFWTPSGGLRPLASAQEFEEFRKPGFARAAISLEIDLLGHGRCRVMTRTRVAATSDEARRRFGAYWALIRPGSAMLRWSFLATVRDRAESRSLEAGVERAATG